MQPTEMRRSRCSEPFWGPKYNTPPLFRLAAYRSAFRVFVTLEKPSGAINLVAAVSPFLAGSDQAAIRYPFALSGVA